jgi:hypothetical protein
MNRSIILFLTGLFFIGEARAQVSFEKIDTTMKVGKTGFKVNCRNKEINSNQLSVRPIGFESPANETLNFPVKGRISSVAVDDFNHDGNADLIMFIYSDSNARHGTALALISDGTKSLMPCVLPDVALDGKINSGYKGYDQFTLMEGTLLQKFPVFKPDDKETATGGNRVVQYTFGRTENGGFKFAVLRTYDTH